MKFVDSPNILDSYLGFQFHRGLQPQNSPVKAELGGVYDLDLRKIQEKDEVNLCQKFW